ncbi:butyrophilin subfamily 3 member A2-like isoform X1 [Poecilia latipinna]|uniref:butyrophilin subfamily 3 member A2-like isoform X1 n=1 Tax=Poecilia latipinna TaxID=48699 RepID=UPI00072E0193|nr:PREDICTED: butyrophilin subfamily 3 member A2-like isoform X1 [Poecilia latipinna]
MLQVHRAYRRPLVISRTCWTDSRAFLRFSAAHVVVLSVVVFALCCSTVSADVTPKTIVALENETVTLPCRTNRTSDLLTVEWSKAEMSPNITLLYRHGRETVEEKNSAFVNRTKLLLEEVKHGNISQVISKLRLSDGGRYLCRTMVGKQRQVEAALDLIVGAASEPKLTFVPSGANGGLTLECSAERWFPKPEITFHDENGKEIEAEDPRIDLDSAGCFNVKRRASLQIVTNGVTCRVHQPLLKRRHAHIYIPDDCMRSCTSSIVWSVMVTAAALGLCAVAYFLWKKYGRSCCRQKSLQPIQVSSPSTQNATNTQLQGQIKGLQSEIERLQGKIKGLKLCNSEKDDIIAKQKAEVEELKSKYSAAQQQNQPTMSSSSSLNASHQVTQTLDHSNTPPAATSASHDPKPGHVSKAKDPKPAGSGPARLPAPSRKDRPKSTPDLFSNNVSASSSSSSASTSKEKKILHSVSFSSSRPDVARPLRRYTIGSHGVPTGNPFSVLADLTEESESLIQ